MLTEPVPINLFVNRLMADHRIIAIVENWRVESEVIQGIVVAHFREMGIFEVLPPLESEMREMIIFLLQNSPDVITVVHKASQADLARRQVRHADD